MAFGEIRGDGRGMGDKRGGRKRDGGEKDEKEI